jgi:hypothetical protein
MKGSKVVPMLSYMSANKALAVTEALSMRKIFPGWKALPSGDLIYVVSWPKARNISTNSAYARSLY